MSLGKTTDKYRFLQRQLGFLVALWHSALLNEERLCCIAWLKWFVCRECQKKDWSSHKLACEKCGDPVGCPFVVSVPLSKANYKSLYQLLHDYTRYLSEDSFITSIIEEVMWFQHLSLCCFARRTRKVSALRVGPPGYLATHPPPSDCPWREEGAHVPKAQELQRCSQGLQPCNTEGAKGLSRTDRQTYFCTLQ